MKINCNHNSVEDELKQMATRKVLKLKSFYIHTFVYVSAIIIYVLKEYFGFRFNFFPLRYINGFVMIVWSVAFLVTLIEMITSFKIFGEEWEERKVKSILGKNSKNQKWE